MAQSNFKNWLTSVRYALAAFQKSQMVPNLLKPDDYGDFGIRRLRYDINWSFYSNTVYDDLHAWSLAYRSQYGLSKYVRPIYNPVYRLGEFWTAHIWGGSFDPELGDGAKTKTSLPLAFRPTANQEAIKTALAQVYDWSNWQSRKNLLVRWGTVLGDVGLRIVDRPGEGRLFLDVIHPGSIAEYEADDRGNILSYRIEEERTDPEDPTGQNKVVYREEVSNNSGNITYITYRDNDPYPWYNGQESWSIEYGFTPMVLINHIDIGKPWGWSEFHPLRTKIHNLDDVATSLADWVRVNSHSPWLFSGVKKPKVTPQTEGAVATADSRYPVKDNLRALYAPLGASAQELVSKMPVEEVTILLAQMLEEIEKDYPELSKDLWDNAQETSARAVRIKRQRTEKKAEERRAIYDDALRRINMMAMSIGAARRYKGFEGLSVTSYDAGQLDHYIAPRPVFAQDDLEELEIEEAFWKAAKVSKEAGFPLEVFLKRKGWTDEEIAEMTESEEYQTRMKLQAMALEQPALRPLDDAGGRPQENGAGAERNPDRE